jgi:hypothetical protein
MPVDWKYNENEIVGELIEYLSSTYSQHYTNEMNDVQALDVYIARGTMGTTCIDNAIKYLIRYGKKEGANRKDLFKVLHYVVLALGYEKMLDNMPDPKDQTEIDFYPDDVISSPSDRNYEDADGDSGAYYKHTGTYAEEQ